MKRVSGLQKKKLAMLFLIYCSVSSGTAPLAVSFFSGGIPAYAPYIS